MEQFPKTIELNGLWIDSMDNLKKELLKALHLNPENVRADHFEEDLLPWIQQLGNPTPEVVWKCHSISRDKMRFVLVPTVIEFISTPGMSNMMFDAVNAKADRQAAEHRRISQEPLEKLLAEIDAFFGRLGLRVTYLEWE